MALSFVALLVLRAIAVGHRFGFDVMDATGLPSGTVYPALRRLQALGLISSAWEDQAKASKAGRPRRRNYAVTRDGRLELAGSADRFAALSRLVEKRARP
jgi:PadR family transcriptional regulator, regulatory protein PadR